MEPLYIIDVHIMILKDQKFIDRTIRNIRELGVNAEWAVRMTVDRYREIFAQMKDDYLRGVSAISSTLVSASLPTWGKEKAYHRYGGGRGRHHRL
jgi:signal transduction protein with GAF and PtsI domain